jgi:hypothetical protein
MAQSCYYNRLAAEPSTFSANQTFHSLQLTYNSTITKRCCVHSNVNKTATATEASHTCLLYYSTAHRFCTLLCSVRSVLLLLSSISDSFVPILLLYLMTSLLWCTNMSFRNTASHTKSVSCTLVLLLTASTSHAAAVCFYVSLLPAATIL